MAEELNKYYILRKFYIEGVNNKKEPIHKMKEIACFESVELANAYVDKIIKEETDTYEVKEMLTYKPLVQESFLLPFNPIL